MPVYIKETYARSRYTAGALPAGTAQRASDRAVRRRVPNGVVAVLLVLDEAGHEAHLPRIKVSADRIVSRRVT